MKHKKLVRSIGALWLAVAIVAGCSKPAQQQTAAPKQDILVADMDTSVNPGDDFFAYANGGWLKRNPIPASESAWGIGNVVRDELYEQLRTINETAAKKNGAAGTDEQKIGDFWTTAMDEAKADQSGLTPLKPELDRISAIMNTQDAIKEAFALQPLGIDAFFGFYIAQDEKQSDVMSVHLQQGGLGLPDRDFYFNSEAGVANIRKEYVAHLEKTLKLIGTDDAAAKENAARIMDFETALAKISRKLEDLRDPIRNYNKMTVADVRQKHTPSIAWDDQLAGWNLRPSYVVVGQPEFFTGVEALLKKTPVPVLRDDLLPSGQRVRGIPQQGHRRRRFQFLPPGTLRPEGTAASLEAQSRCGERRHGHGVGPHLCEGVLSGICQETIFGSGRSDPHDVRRTHRPDRLDERCNQSQSHQKLAAVNKKVGYPDKWKDYSALMIGRSSYCENMMSAARWRFDDMVSKFGKPVDRTEWTMTPQTYNAYYNASNNEIVLPAAIFEIPGMKDSEVDDAVVYGYAGASTIGHEITHGFDDEGRQYDAAGNLAEWWTKEDAAKFQQRAAIMVKQFDGYEPLPGLHINGKASLGENIADYGGILLGLDAFKKTDQYKKGEKIAGLTPLQRYFLGYALGWQEQRREELIRRGL